jgi:hypothetical protein
MATRLTRKTVAQPSEKRSYRGSTRGSRTPQGEGLNSRLDGALRVRDG